MRTALSVSKRQAAWQAADGAILKLIGLIQEGIRKEEINLDDSETTLNSLAQVLPLLAEASPQYGAYYSSVAAWARGVVCLLRCAPTGQDTSYFQSALSYFEEAISVLSLLKKTQPRKKKNKSRTSELPASLTTLLQALSDCLATFSCSSGQAQQLLGVMMRYSGCFQSDAVAQLLVLVGTQSLLYQNAGAAGNLNSIDERCESIAKDLKDLTPATQALTISLRITVRLAQAQGEENFLAAQNKIKDAVLLREKLYHTIQKETDSQNQLGLQGIWRTVESSLFAVTLSLLVNKLKVSDASELIQWIVPKYVSQNVPLLAHNALLPEVLSQFIEDIPPEDQRLPVARIMQLFSAWCSSVDDQGFSLLSLFQQLDQQLSLSEQIKNRIKHALWQAILHEGLMRVDRYREDGEKCSETLKNMQAVREYWEEYRGRVQDAVDPLLLAQNLIVEFYFQEKKSGWNTVCVYAEHILTLIDIEQYPADEKPEEYQNALQLLLEAYSALSSFYLLPITSKTVVVDVLETSALEFWDTVVNQAIQTAEALSKTKTTVRNAHYDVIQAQCYVSRFFYRSVTGKIEGAIEDYKKIAWWSKRSLAYFSSREYPWFHVKWMNTYVAIARQLYQMGKIDNAIAACEHAHLILNGIDSLSSDKQDQYKEVITAAETEFLYKELKTVTAGISFTQFKEKPGLRVFTKWGITSEEDSNGNIAFTITITGQYTPRKAQSILEEIRKFKAKHFSSSTGNSTPKKMESSQIEEKQGVDAKSFVQEFLRIEREALRSARKQNREDRSQHILNLINERNARKQESKKNKSEKTEAEKELQRTRVEQYKKAKKEEQVKKENKKKKKEVCDPGSEIDLTFSTQRFFVVPSSDKEAEKFKNLLALLHVELQQLMNQTTPSAWTPAKTREILFYLLQSFRLLPNLYTECDKSIINTIIHGLVLVAESTVDDLPAMIDLVTRATKGEEIYSHDVTRSAWYKKILLQQENASFSVEDYMSRVYRLLEEIPLEASLEAAEDALNPNVGCIFTFIGELYKQLLEYKVNEYRVASNPSSPDIYFLYKDAEDWVLATVGLTRPQIHFLNDCKALRNAVTHCAPEEDRQTLFNMVRRQFAYVYDRSLRDTLFQYIEQCKHLSEYDAAREVNSDRVTAINGPS